MNAINAEPSVAEHALIWQGHIDGYDAEIWPNIGAQRAQVEQALVAEGVSLPLPHRSEWGREFGGPDSLFIALRGADGKYRFGFTVDVSRSRALPGHLLLRVKRFGATADAAAAAAGLRALHRYVQEQPRILRVYFEIFTRNHDLRLELAQLANELGYTQSPNASSYKNTVVVDLTPEESEIFAAFDRSARRNVKAPGKKGFETTAITDTVYVDRMHELMEETLARTGGQYEKMAWAQLIDFSSQHPELARVVGTFLPESSEPEALVSFAWGAFHGDHATHTNAASTRAIKSNVALSYAVSWDLICWAKRNGASWFDFGGVTQGSLEDTDSLGGISDFKRFFSKDVVTVGDEWILEPHPLRARLAKMVSSAARQTRKVING